MRSGGGKNKGSSFERSICIDLSRWVSNGTQDDVFWRSAVSGGRSTVAAKKGKRLTAQVGDISCIHPCGAAFAAKFMVECKHYADLDFEGLITGKGNLVGFWKIAITEARRCEKMALLVAKQNRLPTIACLTEEGAGTLNLLSHELLMASVYDLLIIDWDKFLRIAECPN